MVALGQHMGFVGQWGGSQTQRARSYNSIKAFERADPSLTSTWRLRLRRSMVKSWCHLTSGCAGFSPSVNGGALFRFARIARPVVSIALSLREMGITSHMRQNLSKSG